MLEFPGVPSADSFNVYAIGPSQFKLPNPMRPNALQPLSQPNVDKSDSTFLSG